MSDLVEILRSLLEAQRRKVLSEQSVAVSLQSETAYRSLLDSLQIELTEEASLQKLKGRLLLTDLASYDVPWVDVLVRGQTIRVTILSSSGSQAEISPVYVCGQDARGRALDAITGLLSDGQASTAKAGYAALVLSDDPKGYWPLNDAAGSQAANWADRSVAGSYVENVVPRGSRCLAGDVFGLAQFAGGQVAIPHSVAFEGWSAMTVELWCLPDQLPMGLVAKTVGPGHQGFWLWLEATGPKAGFSDGTSTVYVSGSASVSTGALYHVALTYASGTAGLWLNGSSVGSGSVGSGFLASKKSIRIGKDAEGRTASGSIGHVAIYDYALPSARISAHAGFSEDYTRSIYMNSLGIIAIDYVSKGTVQVSR